MVISCPCIGNIKDLQTLFTLSFASEVFARLWAALCSFHGCHERRFPSLLAPRLLFDVAVVSRTRSLIANLLSFELYHASVYWFLSLVLGLSIAQSCSPHGLPLLCKAKPICHCLCSTVIVGFGDSCVCITQLVTVSSLLNTLLFTGKNILVFIV